MDVWCWWRRGRRALLVVAAVWCFVLGIGVTASLVDHGALGKAGTLTLLGAVGMLVLPALTAIALRVDGRERRRMHLRETNGAAEAPSDTNTHPHAHPPHRVSPEHRARPTAGRGAHNRAHEDRPVA